MTDGIIRLFPGERRDFWQETAQLEAELQEIRLRAGKPVVLLHHGKERYLNAAGSLTDRLSEAYCTDSMELTGLLQHICNYSLYAYEEELSQGYLTVPGGHRVGVAGQAVAEGTEKIRTIKYISCMNIRIAHERRGVADNVLPKLYQGGRILNTLIISPPGCGKTTLLRDLIRQVSDGSVYGCGQSVGVVDERSELAGCYQGIPQLDVGMRTDVLDACPKALGMMLLLRSMSPGVIAVDELGGAGDLEALSLAASCGSAILATAHGEGIQDAVRKLGRDILLRQRLFQRFLVLGREKGVPVIRKLYGEEAADAAFTGRMYDCDRQSGTGNLVSGAVASQAANSPYSNGNTGAFNE